MKENIKDAIIITSIIIIATTAFGCLLYVTSIFNTPKPINHPLCQKVSV